MGTPLIEDTFNPDRWDYRYIIRNGTTTLEESTLTVFFEGDALVNVAGSEVPEWAGGDVVSEASEDVEES